MNEEKMKNYTAELAYIRNKMNALSINLDALLGSMKDNCLEDDEIEGLRLVYGDAFGKLRDELKNVEEDLQGLVN